MEILDIKIDEFDLIKAQERVRDFLLNSGQFIIFTPNPEMLVKAQKDEYFKQILNASDLNLCDGFGILLLAKLLQWARSGCGSKKNILHRITGADFMFDICKIAQEHSKSVYLLGSNSDKIIKEAAYNLQKQFPNLIIAGFDKGPKVKEEKDGLLVDRVDIIDSINNVKPDIIFVAFGMGKQEKWIYENIDKIPSAKIAMGVGGTFEFLSGEIKRAPCWMRKIGLEWMYRLWKQPSRIKRIYNALVIFPITILINYGKRNKK